MSTLNPAATTNSNKYRNIAPTQTIMTSSTVTNMVPYPVSTFIIRGGLIKPGATFRLVHNLEFNTTTETAAYIPYIKINGIEVLHGDRQNIIGHTSKRQIMSDGIISIEEGKCVVSVPSVVSFLSTGAVCTHGIWGDVNITMGSPITVEYGFMSYSTVTSVTAIRKPSFILEV